MKGKNYEERRRWRRIDSGLVEDVYSDLLQTLLQLTESRSACLFMIRTASAGGMELWKHSTVNDSETSPIRIPSKVMHLDTSNVSVSSDILEQIFYSAKPLFLNNLGPSKTVRMAGVEFQSFQNLLGIPLFSRNQLIAIVCLINRAEGYSESVHTMVKPWCRACVSTMVFQSDSSVIERALHESEMQQRAILDSALDAIITIDTSGTIVSVNPATHKIFGYGAEEISGKKIEMLMPKPFTDHHDEFIKTYLETGKAKIIGKNREAVGLHKNGDTFPIHLAVSEIKLDGQRLFTGIIRDISQQKAAEKKVSKVMRDLEKSRDDLLLVLNHLRIGTIVVNETGNIVFISETCENIDGIHRHESIGSHWEKALPFSRSSRDKLKHLLSISESERTRITLTLDSQKGTQFSLEADVWDDPRDRKRQIICLYDMTEVYNLRNQVKQKQYHRMIGNSPPMLRMYETFEQVARGNWTVLIEGETGVGKELVARSIHSASPRKNGSFIAVNCAGLTESLLADQLFGHKKGAFTGAVSDQEGIFEAAEGGTLFLDEIGEIPLSMQSSLLRVLQEHEIVRVGEIKPRKVDVRILAATNKNLGELTSQGRFREDLLYRIRVARIIVPPLRERIDDLPMLIEAFLSESRIASGKPGISIGKETLRYLENYHWPGNVRELKNTIDYAVIHCRASEIQIQDLPPEIRNPEYANMPFSVDPTLPEKKEIMDALQKCAGNRTKAARMMNISRATFYRKLRKYGIEAEK